MAKAQPKKPGKPVRVSPLHTSKRRELEKLTALQGLGRDSDGAFRVRNRLDGKDKSNVA